LRIHGYDVSVGLQKEAEKKRHGEAKARITSIYEKVNLTLTSLFNNFSSLANLRVEIHPYQVAQDNRKIGGMIQITTPQRLSFTKLMEEQFATAEIKVNDMLEKYLGVKSDCVTKDSKESMEEWKQKNSREKSACDK
jgi:hypothetical protein